MKINISTRVNQHYLSVKDGFNPDLFERLNPPFPPVKLLKFDGSEVGDLVSLELDFLLFKQIWTSEITESETSASEYYFVDVGIQLPFFLKSWRHKHRILNLGEESIIRDEIEFTSPIAWLLFPVMYLQFLYRRPIYRKVFA